MNPLNTKEIASQYGRYIDNAENFFGNFQRAWENVHFQVVKLETRQEYIETDNESYRAFISGDTAKAIELIKKSREADVALYNSLIQRGVDFIRCRPVIYPLSDYLKWETEIYKFNEDHGEKIYLTENLVPFDEIAFHDFMIFDQNYAVIHNYDDQGIIQGGWLVESVSAINNLLLIFAIIKSTSKRFQYTNAYQGFHSEDFTSGKLG